LRANSLPESGEGQLTEACRLYSQRYLNGEPIENWKPQEEPLE
jgi:hypothetical protein